jgi:uncharacterized protein with ParB-like and HNH nuclease domain
MKSALQINTRVRRLFHYIDDFHKGLIRIPAFQRDFVWKINDKIDLFDSIKKGYPIGSILFWRPEQDSHSDHLQFELDRLGSYYIPRHSGDFFFILDGFQRLSTLIGCLINPFKTELIQDRKEWLEKFNVIYNLKSDEFEHSKRSNFDELDIHKVPLYRFIDSKEFFGYQKQLFTSGLPENIISDYIKKYENLSSKLVDYQIPSIDIIGGSVSEAVDIFSRVNSKGAIITDDWKVSALSYDHNRNFRLSSEIDQLIEDLIPYNFESIKRSVVLQCIINSFDKVFFDQSSSRKLEELAKRTDFIDVTKLTLENIKVAIKFLYSQLGVLHYKLLPYPIQLVFITDFFYKKTSPTNTQISELKKWFWFTSYSNYFTLYNLSKQRMAYEKFQDFIYDSSASPVFIDDYRKPFVVAPFPEKLHLGSVRTKSLILFMISKQIREVDLSSGNFTYTTFKLTDDPLHSQNIENNIIKLVPADTTQRKSSENGKYIIIGEDNDLFITQPMFADWAIYGSLYILLEQRKSQIKVEEKAFVDALEIEYRQ